MMAQISYSDEISKSRNEFPLPYSTQALSFCIELEFGNHKTPHRRAFESSSETSCLQDALHEEYCPR